MVQMFTPAPKTEEPKKKGKAKPSYKRLSLTRTPKWKPETPDEHIDPSQFAPPPTPNYKQIMVAYRQRNEGQQEASEPRRPPSVDLDVAGQFATASYGLPAAKTRGRHWESSGEAAKKTPSKKASLEKTAKGTRLENNEKCN